MKKFTLGTKKGMTQFFTPEGVSHAATVIAVPPVVVTQVKTADRDGYVALQVGSGERNTKNIAKAQQGHFKKLGNFRYVREFRVRDIDDAIKAGTTLEAKDLFEIGQKVTVSGISKGKGFQGVVKRHNFSGGPRSHGQKHTERSPGSIGAQQPQRVLKGTRMAGRMGSDRITVKNLKVLAIDEAENLMLVKGAVPGKPGTLLEIVATS